MVLARSPATLGDALDYFERAAQLGHPFARQRAGAIRLQLGEIVPLESEPIQTADGWVEKGV